MGRWVTISGEESRAVVLVLASGVEVPILQGEAPLHPDLSVVDALARMELEARRRGGSIGLRNPCPKLLELLELVGLAGFLVEVDGEAEGGEQLGVQEVVEPDDPAV